MIDRELGISLRFIRQWRAELIGTSLQFHDRALMLAAHDPRTDVSFAVKVADAQTFLRRQVH